MVAAWQMRLMLVVLMACVSVLAQVNLKVTSPQLPLTFADASNLGLLRSFVLVGRAAFLSGMALLLTWYAYRYFQFLELFVASSLTYLFALLASYLIFNEPVTWTRMAAVGLVCAGTTLFFVK
jgi:drug/metabolite transporter (DMT)-like permease